MEHIRAEDMRHIAVGAVAQLERVALAPHLTECNHCRARFWSLIVTIARAEADIARDAT